MILEAGKMMSGFAAPCRVPRRMWCNCNLNSGYFPGGVVAAAPLSRQIGFWVSAYSRKTLFWARFEVPCEGSLWSLWHDSSGAEPDRSIEYCTAPRYVYPSSASNILAPIESEPPMRTPDHGAELIL